MRTAPTEHRLNPRQPLQLDVMLHVPGQKPFSGYSRNASLGGLFVETDAARLYRDAELYIALALPHKDEMNHYRTPVRHVWQAENGAGLLFTSPETELIRTLRQLLYPAPAIVPLTCPDHAARLRRQG